MWCLDYKEKFLVYFSIIMVQEVRMKCLDAVNTLKSGKNRTFSVIKAELLR